MRNSKFLIAFLVALSGCLGMAAFKSPSGKVTMTIRCVDDTGAPVEGANVQISFEQAKGGFDTREGLSDEDGYFSHRADVFTRIYLKATKEGYYAYDKDAKPYRMEGELTVLKNGKPIYEDQQADLILKRIKEPVALRGKVSFSVKVPQLEQLLGFDMEMMDWVAPHGSGRTNDLFFEVNGYFNKPEDRQSKLRLSFPNEGDGVISFQMDHKRGSKLKSDHLAPEIGYEESKIWHRNYVITRPMHTPDESPGNVVNEFSKDSGLFLRLRTELNENGEVIRANYAKLYGDPTFSWNIRTGEGTIHFRHVYFNPEVNDRNLEFDLGRNLFKDLERKHRPRFP